MRMSEINIKTKKALANRDFEAMNEAVKDALNTGIPSVYASTLASRDALREALPDHMIPDLQSSQEERLAAAAILLNGNYKKTHDQNDIELPTAEKVAKYEANLNYEQKFELLKSAMKNGRGFFCDRDFVLIGRTNGANGTEPHLVFGKLREPRDLERAADMTDIYRKVFADQDMDGKISSYLPQIRGHEATKLYRELFWDENRDKVLMSYSPQAVSRLAQIINSEVQKCDNIQQAERFVQNAYDEFLEIEVESAIANGKFDNRFMKIAKTMDDDEETTTRMDMLREKYSTMLERAVIDSGEAWNAVNYIASALQIPIEIGYKTKEVRK